MLYYLFWQSHSRQDDAVVLLLKEVVGQLVINVHPICNNLTQPMFLGNSPVFFFFFGVSTDSWVALDSARQQSFGGRKLSGDWSHL